MTAFSAPANHETFNAYHRRSAMRTLNLFLILTGSLALSSPAMGQTEVGIDDETEVREIAHRDLNFVCGTPDDLDAGTRQLVSDILSQTSDIDYSSFTVDEPSADLAATDPSASDINVDGGNDLPIFYPDLNGDGAIGIDDLLLVLQGWGACATASQTACAGDANGDGMVNEGDLLMVIMHWQRPLQEPALDASP
jgi:hypothetical protein